MITVTHINGAGEARSFEHEGLENTLDLSEYRDGDTIVVTLVLSHVVGVRTTYKVRGGTLRRVTERTFVPRGELARREEGER